MRSVAHSFLAWLFALASWGWGAAAVGLTIEITPEMDLESARCHHERGTNFLAQGMLREARAELETAAQYAVRRGVELRRRSESLAILREQADVIRLARRRFEEDWTTAAEEAGTIREPLQQVLDLVNADERRLEACLNHSPGLGLMGERLELILQMLSSLSEAVTEGRQGDAATSLHHLQAELDRVIADSVALMDLSGNFDEVGTGIAQALKQFRKAEDLKAAAERMLPEEP